MPLDPQITKLADAGEIEQYQTNELAEIYKIIDEVPARKVQE